MTTRLPISPAPGPLEAFAQHFDPLFTQRSQRQAFRDYLAGLLLPAERNKTLTALAHTEPIVGAQAAPPNACSGSSPNQRGMRTQSMPVALPPCAPCPRPLRMATGRW